MKKNLYYFIGALVSASLSVNAAKYLNEWTFDTDADGAELSAAVNSGTNASLAVFASGGLADIYTTNGTLRASASGTNAWTGGNVLSASPVSPSSGIHFIRYDVNYDFSTVTNDTGIFLGVYLSDGSTNVAGLAIGYDTGTLSNDIPRNLRTVTEITNKGTLTAIAKIDTGSGKISAWYDSFGGGSITTNSLPSAETNISLSSISQLNFHCTGNFAPAAPAYFDNIRHASSMAEILEPLFSTALPTPPPAGAMVKANNFDNLNLGSSWVGGVAPGSADYAFMNEVVTMPITNSLGASLSWKGIILAGNTVPWEISDAVNTLTIGSGGIDMSAAGENLTIDARTVLGSAQTWNVVTSRVLTVSRMISGNADSTLVKTGEGELILKGFNLYSGGTVLSNGTLAVEDNNALGEGILTVDNATLVSRAPATETAADINLTGAMTVSNASAFVLGGAISGTGSLTKASGSQLTLTGINTYSGGTTNFGTIYFSQNQALGTESIVMESGSSLFRTMNSDTWNTTVPLGNDIILNGDATIGCDSTAGGNTFILGGSISGTNNLTIQANVTALWGSSPDFSGSVLLTNANLYMLPDALGSGRIEVAGGASRMIYISGGSGVVKNDIHLLPSGGNGTQTTNWTLSLRTQNIQSDGVEFAGKFSADPSSTNGYRNVELAVNSGLYILSGDNSGFNGQFINIRTETSGSGGKIIKIAHTNALGNGGVTFGHATQGSAADFTRMIFDVPMTISIPFGFHGNGNFDVELQTDKDIEFTGAFTNGLLTTSFGGGVVKTGAKKMTLASTATATYDRKFDIKEGELEVNTAFSSSEITVHDGAILSGTASVNKVTMQSGSTLSLTNGGMTFNGHLQQFSNAKTRLAVKNTSSALKGNGSNILLANGTLFLDFANNAGAVSGAVFTVFSGWNQLENLGLAVLPVNLPSFMTLDTSMLFVDGTVKIVSSSSTTPGGTTGNGLVSSPTVQITVPQGETGSGTLTLGNAGSSSLGFSIPAAQNWLNGEYAVAKILDDILSAPTLSNSDDTRFFNYLSWSVNQSVWMNIGFDMPVKGGIYSQFAVTTGGTVILKSSDNKTVVLKPYATGTLIPTNSIRYIRSPKDGAQRLVVSWTIDGTEFQAWLFNDGRIQYLYQNGSWNSGVIGVGSQTCDYTVGSTARDSILFTPASWMSISPSSGTVPANGQLSVAITADTSGLIAGQEYLLPLTVTFSDGSSSPVMLIVTVTDSDSVGLLIPSSVSFSGAAGFIHETTVVITNTSNSTSIDYTVTDDGLRTAGYNITNITFQYANHPGWTPSLTASDLGTKQINIGFPFAFSGNIYTSLIVRADGTLMFESGMTISPYKAPLILGSSGRIIAYTGIGDSDNFYVTWENVAHAGSAQTFQAVLNRSGTIRFNYSHLGAGWTNAAVQLETGSGVVTGSLINANTLITKTVTNVTTITVTNYSGPHPIVTSQKVTNTVTTSEFVDVNNLSLGFIPGARRVISIEPVSGTVLPGSAATVRIKGDARSLGIGTNSAVATNTTFVFHYAATNAAMDVTFTATNSASISYPALMMAQQLLAGVPPQNFIASSVVDSSGNRVISWPVPPYDGFHRDYEIWFTTDLTAGWTHLATVRDSDSFTDTNHNNEPVIFYKVVVQ